MQYECAVSKPVTCFAAFKYLLIGQPVAVGVVVRAPYAAVKAVVFAAVCKLYQPTQVYILSVDLAALFVRKAEKQFIAAVAFYEQFKLLVRKVMCICKFSCKLFGSICNFDHIFIASIAVIYSRVGTNMPLCGLPL